MDCLLDTNILLRMIDRQHAASKLVRKALEILRAGDHNLFIAPQNLVEFWAVATRPASSNGLGLSPQQVEALIIRFRILFLL